MTDKKEGRSMISFRLRKVDDDLRRAVASIGNDELSQLARDGLRYMLGLRTTKTVQVRTEPIRPKQQPPANVWHPPDLKR